MSRLTFTLHQLDGHARRIGELQAKLRLLIDTAPAELRDAIEAAANHLDEADELLTQAYCEAAPTPREYLPRIEPPPPATVPLCREDAA